jgi:hypothetical protein
MIIFPPVLINFSLILVPLFTVLHEEFFIKEQTVNWGCLR